MNDLAKQFSLSEVLGNFVPGAMVLTSFVYLFVAVSALGTPPSEAAAGIDKIASGTVVAFAFFALSYGIGMLLTSLSQTLFQLIGAQSNSDLTNNGATKTRTARHVLARYVGRFGILNRWDDIARLRRDWTTSIVADGVATQEILGKLTVFYEDLFGVLPRGEDALVLCELYVREKAPVAAAHIERQATRAALLGNLVLPVLFWFAALLAGVGLSSLSIVKGGLASSGWSWIPVVLQVGLLIVLLEATRLVSKVVGERWLLAAKEQLRDTVLAFVLVGSLARSRDREQSSGSGGGT